MPRRIINECFVVQWNDNQRLLTRPWHYLHHAQKSSRRAEVRVSNIEFELTCGGRQYHKQTEGIKPPNCLWFRRLVMFSSFHAPNLFANVGSYRGVIICR